MNRAWARTSVGSPRPADSRASARECPVLATTVPRGTSRVESRPRPVGKLRPAGQATSQQVDLV